jgi:hypothetical protein
MPGTASDAAGCVGDTPERFAAFIPRERVRLGEVVKASGVQPR